jgi:hypothetical protein
MLSIFSCFIHTFSMIRITLLFLLCALINPSGYAQNKQLTPQPAGINPEQPATNVTITPADGNTVLPANSNTKAAHPTGKVSDFKGTVVSPAEGGVLVPLTTAPGTLKFDRFMHGFGTLKQNQTTEAVFNFTNTGKQPVTLAKVETACDCMVAEYPKTAIAAGEKATIKVRFDAKDRLGKVTKSVFIKTDEPSQSSSYTLNLHGTVVKTNE